MKLKRPKYWTIARFGLLSVLVLLVVASKIMLPSKPAIPVSRRLDTSFAFRQDLFLSAVSSIASSSSESLPEFSILLAPHHLVASSMIAKAASLLPNHTQSSNRIFIIGPNHSDTGNCPIITSKTNWTTSFGEQVVDSKAVDQLVATTTLCEDTNAISGEHSVAAIIPFVKYYSPKAKIIPIIMNKNVNSADLSTLTKALSEFSKDSVFLFSIDFSHGESVEQAKANTKMIQNTIDRLSPESIESLGQNYTDSPSSLSLLLRLKAALSLPKSYLFSSTEAGEFIDRDTSNTTSYLLLGYPKSLPNKKISLIFGGDVMLGRSVNTRSLKYKDFTWAFKNISNLFSSADFAMVNLEAPFNKECPKTDQGMVFCAPPDHIAGLMMAGIDLVSIENNHIQNQGQEGYRFTKELLIENQISPSSTDPIIKRVNNVSIGFLSFNFIGTAMKSEEFSKRIKELDPNVDILVTSFHWGNEYQSKPSQSQVNTAHIAIESGSDIVVGHHPHWIQADEIYLNKPVFYSLGNLIFDQMWSKETKKGMVVKLEYNGAYLSKIERIYVQIEDYGQPKVVSSQ